MYTNSKPRVSLIWLNAGIAMFSLNFWHKTRKAVGGIYFFYAPNCVNFAVVLKYFCLYAAFLSCGVYGGRR